MATRKNVIVEQILPEIKVGGIDYSLLTQREWHFFKIYSDMRKEFSEKYPKPKEQQRDEDDTFIDSLAMQDIKAPQFRKVLMIIEGLLEKIDTINMLCTPYELHCIRLYCKYLVNALCDVESKKRKEGIKQFLSVFRDIDIYEIVESYFKIIRKYGLPTHEEPYYWLSPKRRREIKYEGEMLKRSTLFDESEIRVSLLEELV